MKFYWHADNKPIGERDGPVFYWFDGKAIIMRRCLLAPNEPCVRDSLGILWTGQRFYDMVEFSGLKEDVSRMGGTV
jgi:hypothetical protein